MVNSCSKIAIFTVSFLSLIFFVTVSEFIYPLFLSSSQYSRSYIVDTVQKTNDRIVDNEVTKSDSSLDIAQSYLTNAQYSSAWILADNFLIKNPDSILAEDIKKEAERHLKGIRVRETNPRYIEGVQYNKLLSQNNIIDAYYYVLDLINSSNSSSYDLNMKLESCYHELITDNYSIEEMDTVLTYDGYNDVEFYYIGDGIIRYKIERLVEFDGQYYLKGVNIDGSYYPYILIRGSGEIISSGFREEYREVIIKDSPHIPILAEELKLFSEEYNKVALSSLYMNIKIYALDLIRYYSPEKLLTLILNKYCSYFIMVVLYFTAWYTSERYNYLDYLFINSVIVYGSIWFIKKISLIISYYGLGLSLGFMTVVFTVWFIYLIKKSTPLPSQS